jgi:hypothetical protein
VNKTNDLSTQRRKLLGKRRCKKADLSKNISVQLIKEERLGTLNQNDI